MSFGLVNTYHRNILLKKLQYYVELVIGFIIEGFVLEVWLGNHLLKKWEFWTVLLFKVLEI